MMDAFPKASTTTTTTTTTNWVESLPSITIRQQEIGMEKRKLQKAMKDLLAKEKALKKEKVAARRR